MADDADWAAMQEEIAWRDLDRRIAAAREHQAPRFASCQSCGLTLPTHRLAYGTCLECHREIERRAGWGV